MIQSTQPFQLESDQELKTRVTNNLVNHHIPGVKWLDIRVHRGVVTLTGRVRSYYHKQLCNHCCRRVAGVFELVDRLEVVELPVAATR